MKTRLMRSVMIMGIAGLVAIALTGVLRNSPHVQAQSPSDEQVLIQIGFEIAPVPLNLAGKDQNLVGLGSFLVNASGDCNGCHTSGLAPNFNFANNHNPFFGQQPAQQDPKTYLSGGTDFGPAVPPSGPPPGFPYYPWATPPIPSTYPPAAYGSYVGPNIITRNLTPDKTGLPEGGRTLAQFEAILTTGIDLDNLHPTCTSPGPPPTPANCIPPPVDGSLLQVMIWPWLHNLPVHYMEAIYTYLSAIPCIEGPKTPADIAAVDPGAVYAFAQLHNDCQ